MPYTDPVKGRENKRRYYVRNRQRIKNSTRRYKIKNRDKLKTYHRQYAENHRDELKRYRRSYRVKNRLRLRVKRRVYNKKKRAKDFNWRLRRVLTSRVGMAIKVGSKSSGTLNLLGCSVGQLREWLEAQFESGMSWKNYGEWHIDHIKPCAAFDLTDSVQQKQCFNFTNLQPLWANENQTKGSHYV